MYFDTFSDFIAMGNHGLYVWLSYGIFTAIILWNLWLVKASRKEALRLAQQAWRRTDADKARTDTEKSRSDTEKGRSEVEKDRTETAANKLESNIESKPE